MNPVPSPSVVDNQGGDVNQEDHPHNINDDDKDDNNENAEQMTQQESQPTSPLELRRSNRDRRLPAKFASGDFQLLTEGDPVFKGYTDANMANDVDSPEYIAVTEACIELLWMKNFLQELGIKQDKYTLYCDSQSAIHLVKNPTFHARSKHIGVRYHWIREVFEAKLLHLEKIHTDHNGSYMMTKTLTMQKLDVCRDEAGLSIIS
uniref:Retrovirus-related Pol polyprotein from transposon TNT 1-94 n=1 Tax=Chenopodium quinoa TaxID=63459 RepID=A0A803L1D0_CHEQI